MLLLGTRVFIRSMAPEALTTSVSACSRTRIPVLVVQEMARGITSKLRWLRLRSVFFEPSWGRPILSFIVPHFLDVLPIFIRHDFSHRAPIVLNFHFVARTLGVEQETFHARKYLKRGVFRMAAATLGLTACNKMNQMALRL